MLLALRGMLEEGDCLVGVADEEEGRARPLESRPGPPTREMHCGEQNSWTEGDCEKGPTHS
jgi:hypothetical protein